MGSNEMRNIVMRRGVRGVTWLVKFERRRPKEAYIYKNFKTIEEAKKFRDKVEKELADEDPCKNTIESKRL